MRTKLTNQELVTFCEQMHLVIHTGISALEGLAAMKSNAESPEAKELLGGIYQQMEKTGSLTEALEKAEAFPPYMLHMVKLGEHAGKLDEVFDSLAGYYEREENITRAVRSAVSYPLIMIVIMLVVVIVLITKVMPVFTRVFDQLGTSMNGFSVRVLQFGTALGRYSVVLVVLLAVIACLCLYFTFTEKGRSQIGKFAQSFGPTKRISEKIACARFADGMAMSLSAGLDADKSLELVSGLVENRNLKAKIDVCKKLTLQGTSLSQAMAEAGIFPGLQGHMIRIGFQAGAIDEVMEKAASRYEDEVEAGVQNMISALEPTLVVILSVVVGIILLSVMLPLAGIMSNIG